MWIERVLGLDMTLDLVSLSHFRLVFEDVN